MSRAASAPQIPCLPVPDRFFEKNAPARSSRKEEVAVASGKKPPDTLTRADSAGVARRAGPESDLTIGPARERPVLWLRRTQPVYLQASAVAFLHAL